MPRSLSALPFWLPYFVLPFEALAIAYGGWWLMVVVVILFWATAAVDALMGLNMDNADPDTPDSDLVWHRLAVMLWPVAQICLIFGGIWSATHNPNLSGAEPFLVMVIVGISTGGTGIVYAHEMMHQSDRLERWLGDILMTLVIYGHFRSEHLLVHHVKVGTPEDSATAPYNMGLYRFYLRVFPGSLASAWKAEAERQQKLGRPATSFGNPFWRYGALSAGFLMVALLVGGLAGVAFFLVQAFVAMLLVEAINYIEHYGLVRQQIGARYEPARLYHSWNSNHPVTNYLLIHLQRHADHHARPDRRYPLLQSADESAAPQLPFGYTIMVLMAFVPPLWQRVMNKRVRKWRADFYPEITDWKKRA